MYSGILEHEKIKKFIEFREINQEDLILVEVLTMFSSDLINLEFHNLFNMYGERSGGELMRMIEYETDYQLKILYGLMYEFYTKYGSAVCWNLVRILEGLKNKENYYRNRKGE